MAVRKQVKVKYYCVSGDTKPSVPDGQELIETDTGREYIRISAAWVLKDAGTKLDELAATTDVTTRNSSTSAHGLLPKLDNDNTHFLNGQGGWTTPSGGLVKPAVYMTGYLSSVNTAGVFWLGLGDLAANGGEGDAQGQVLLNAIQIKQFHFYVKVNAHTASITVRLRDNGADISGTTITITSGTTGLQSLASTISANVSAGHKLSIQIDTTGAGTQNLEGYFTVVFVEQ